MNPDEIELKTIDKLFEYEKHARTIEKMEDGELRLFAKLYCKLYLQQQEVISSLSLIDL